jgi:transposase
MAAAYSDDLRRKLLEAYRAGEGSLPVLAVRFRVSVAWAKKISSTLLHTGKMERPPGRKRGRQSKVTPEVVAYLGSQVEKQSDLTLMTLQQYLERDQKIHLSIGQLWLVLKQIGLRLKKSRSTLPSRTPNGSKLKGNSGRNTPGKSIRHSSSSSTRAVSRRR